MRVTLGPGLISNKYKEGDDDEDYDDVGDDDAVQHSSFSHKNNYSGVFKGQ